MTQIHAILAVCQRRCPVTYLSHTVQQVCEVLFIEYKLFPQCLVNICKEYIPTCLISLQPQDIVDENNYRKYL